MKKRVERETRAPRVGNMFWLRVLSVVLAILLYFSPVLPGGIPTVSAAGVLITRTSASEFYIDSSDNFMCQYVSYQIQNTEPTAYDDIWVEITGFAGGVVSLAPNETNLVNLGSLAPSETKTAFFYLQASGASMVPQSHTINVYDGDPPFGIPLPGSGPFTFTQVSETMSAASNKVNAVVVGPDPPELGGLVTITVDGESGKIGAARIMSFTPATYTNWRADAYELISTDIALTGGNTANLHDQLFYIATSTDNTFYQAVYTFRAVGTTSTPTQISPIADISSGSKLKHTNTTDLATLPPIQPADNLTTLGKGVNPTHLPAGGTADYTLTLTNTGTIDVEVDYIVDTLPTSPDSPTYVAGSSELDGSPIADPTVSGSTLTWKGPFTVPAGGSTDLTYQTAIPGTDGIYTNSAVALIGSEQIDTTVDTSDNAPATTNVTVGALADLRLSKTVDNSAPGVGQNVVYTITVTNDGPDGATGVAVEDILSAGLSYVSDDSGGDYDSGSGIWTVGSVANGASETLNITAQVTGVGTIDNIAQVNASDQIDPDSTPDNDVPAEDDQDLASLTVDTTAPVVTVDFLTTNDTTPELTGTVDDPTATIEVTVDGTTYPATNNGDGTWTLADDTIAPALSDGTYDVAVTATDPATNVGTDATANELVIDTTAPTVTVDALTTNDTTPQLTGTVDDPTATIQVTVDGTTYPATNNGDGTWTLADDTIAPALSEGTYDVAVTATDAATNAGADATANELVIDTTAPTVTVDALTTNDTTPELTGTINDPAATIQVTVDGTTYPATNNGDGTWTLANDTIAPALSEGTYDVAATATDAVTNVGTDATFNELVIDTTAPTVTVDALTTNDTTPQLTGTIDDPTATIQVTVDGTTYPAANNGDGTWTLADDTIAPALSEGTYDVAVTATDAASNVGTDATANELVIDTTAPTVTVNPLATNDTTPELTGTINDPTATIQVTVDGTTYPATNNGDGTWTLADDTIAPALSEGTYDVAVTATDAATNAGADATANELVIDTTAPTVTVDPLATNDRTPQLTGTIDDPTATIQVTVDGTTYPATNNGDGTWNLADDTISPSLADGTYDVAVTAADAATNSGADATANELVIDAPPTVTVNLLTTNDTTPQLTGTVDDPAATVQVTVDGTTYPAANNGDGTWTLADDTIAPALSEGTYDVAVTATDAATNVGIDSTTDELIIDTSAPAVTVDPLTTNDTTPEITGTIDDPTATVQVTVDGTTYPATNNGDGTWTLADGTIAPALSDGTYDVAVAATDAASNPGSDVSSDELVIDTTAPAVTVDPLTTNDTTPEITGTIDDPTATVIVTVNGTDYPAINNGDGTWTLPDDAIAPPLSEGAHDIVVIATDGASNPGSDPSSDELVVDITAPTVSVDPLTTNDTTPEITGTIDDPTATVIVTVNGIDYPAINNGDGTWTLTDGTITSALSDGTHDISVTATDGASNPGTDPTTGELVIDTNAPVVTVDPITSNDTSPQLTGTIDDPTATVIVTVNGIDYIAVNNGDGTWTLPDDTINSALSEGTYDILVTATDGTGNPGTDPTIDELVIESTDSSEESGSGWSWIWWLVLIGSIATWGWGYRLTRQKPPEDGMAVLMGELETE